MYLQVFDRQRSSRRPHRLISRSLYPFWLLLLLAGPLTAQSLQHRRQGAAKIYDEAVQLVSEGQPESLREAIKKFEEVLPLFRALGDHQGEARTVNNLGTVHNSLGNKRKALDYFIQALPLVKANFGPAGEGVLLSNIGNMYSDLGEKPKALDYFAQALPLLRAGQNPGGEAITRNSMGRLHSDLGEQQKAIEQYLQALPLVRAEDNRVVEAETLNNLGFAYKRSSEHQKAIDYYQQSLAIRIELRDPKGEATTLENIARAYEGLYEYQKALDYFNRALRIRQERAEQGEEAGILRAIGELYISLNEYQKALEYLNKAVPIFHAQGETAPEAGTVNSIGYVHSELGEQKKALEYYQQALSLSRGTQDRAGEAHALNNIGGFYRTTGDREQAIEYFVKALAISRLAGDRLTEATTLDNLGSLYSSSGEVQKGLDNFTQALVISRALLDRNREATTLGNIGGVYVAVGEKEKALVYFQQDLAIRQATKERKGEAVALHNIGTVYMLAGEKEKALDNFTRALAIRRAVGDRGGEASTLNSIGSLYFELGSLAERGKALDFFLQALPLFRAVGDRGGEAFALTNLGAVYLFVLSDPQKGLDYCIQALPLVRALGDRSEEALILGNLSATRLLQGNLTEARARIEEAIVIVESIRQKITNQQLRSSYFGSVRDYYEFYILVLMEMHKQNVSAGHDGEALQVSERARARALLETLAEANADIRQGVDPKLVEREHALQQDLNKKAQEQTELSSRPHTREQLDAIAKEIEAQTAEFQQVETQIRQTSPRYAALTQPQPLTLKEIQTTVLDDDTLLLEYSLGVERSYLWAVTKDSITSYELPKSQVIDDAAREVYLLITDVKKWSDSVTGRGVGLDKGIARDPSARDGAQKQQLSAVHLPASLGRLSQMILAPVAAQLGKKRVVVVADGALQFIPFAALPIPHQANEPAETAMLAESAYTPLIVEHEIICLPSASTLAVLRREVRDRTPAAKTVAVVADPVFSSNDERVAKVRKGSSADKSTGSSRTGAGELPSGLERSAEESGVRGRSLPRLPGTRAEATQILLLVPKAEGKEALDFAASRQTVTSGELSQFRYVHFATHGFLNSLHPELSGIVLSMFDDQGVAQDGFLRSHEIFNLKLPAELVVLSACQTGLGKEVKGEGLVSLTRGFMYAGAPRVVVSLWNVNDLATAELMARFYRGMLKDNLRPAAALRAAQVSLMNEHTRNHNWEAPFYWAAFTLQGEWR